MKRNRVSSFKYFFYDFVRVTGLPGYLLFRPKRIYEGEKSKDMFKGGFLLASNHISIFDPMYVHYAVPSRRHHSLIAKEFARNKFLKWMFTVCAQCILLDRQNMDMSTFKEIVDRLKSGEMITIYPEGRVNDTSESLQAYKSGVVMMALRSHKRIVPIYLKRREHWYSRLVYVIGKPIDVYDFAKGKMLTPKEIEEVSKYLENKEKELEQIALRGGK